MHIFLILLAISISACSGIQSRYHAVSAGEDLTQIAKRYEVPVAELRAKNQTVVAQGLKPGSKLYIPFEANPQWNEEFTAAQRRDLASRSGEAGNAAPESSSYSVASAHFSWPVKGGRVSSEFGKRGRGVHEGIDIAAHRGTPIYASRSGHVIYAGNRISGYGNLVIVKHADSFSTVYAHLSRTMVKKGQFVTRGQVLGRVGRTGRATGNHLHFEIRNSRVAVNPLFFLQPRLASNSVGR